MNKHMYAVILVGGSGTRFWPLSRKALPKQFLNIYGDRSLFQQTVSRLSARIDPRHIFIISNIHYKKRVQQQLRSSGVPAANILCEPSAKNTAPAICWAAQVIHRKDPEAVMGVFPSDHLILDPKVFWTVMHNALPLADKDYLVTLGIVPTRPETGYGYLKTGPLKGGSPTSLKVLKFTEKPSLAKAEKFLKAGNYFWNSGMFIWKASVILAEFAKYQPVLAKYFQAHRAPDKRSWPQVPSISVDYGILEKSERVACAKAKGLGWSDVGSWEALHEVLDKDSSGNAVRGDVLHLNNQDTMIWGQHRLVAVVGVKDIVVVDTPDALLVCRRDMSQQVKDIVDLLAKHKRKEHLIYSRSR